jgi:hypothetical protein
VRLDDERRAVRAQLVGQCLPFVHRQDGAEVAYRHVITIDRAGGAVAAFRGRQVRHDLVAVEIEVDPLGAAAAFGAAEQAAVKAPRFFEILHRKGQVKQSRGSHGHIPA